MAVDFQRVIRTEPIDDGQRVKGNMMVTKHVGTRHNLPVASAAAGIAAEMVMEVWWTVNGDACKKLVLGKKLSPFLREQCSIGLKRIGDIHPVTAVLLHVFNSLAEETQSRQRWFSPLPAEEVRFHWDGKVFRAQLFQQGSGHKMFPVPEYLRLGGVEAIAAAQIAVKGNGFDEK